MKRLRHITKEYVAHERGDLGTNITDADFPIVVGYQGRSEIAYDQSDLDDILDDIAPGRGPGIPYSLDSLSEMEPDETPVGIEIETFTESKDMRITKKQLRGIIREVAFSDETEAGQVLSTWEEDEDFRLEVEFEASIKSLIVGYHKDGLGRKNIANVLGRFAKKYARY